MAKKIEHKPVIETIINTAALALTAFGTNLLLDKDMFGLALIGVGMTIEFYKYWGRKHKYW